MYTWRSFKKVYEGFPLFLRRPIDLDIETLRPSHPILAVVTHKFTKRQSNGLPDPDYNDTLLDMDRRLTRAFNVDTMGVPVLVETFGGNRIYYFYLAADTEINTVISPIALMYPAEQLTWSVRSDPSWGFLDKYSKELFE